MAFTRKRASITEWTADRWYRDFFNGCRLPEDDAENYAVIFAQNGMRSDMLQLLNKDLLKEMKIVKVGHIIEILRASQEASSQEQRSEISHTTKLPTPTVQSKVVNLKSVVNTKDSRLRRENEVGGAKRDISGLKRPVPDEGPTLSVKMPAKMMRQAPSNVQEEESSNLVKTPVKDRTSAQSVEVSSSTEKKQKKSVFDRLGCITTPPTHANVQTSPGSILKKSPNNQGPSGVPVVRYGPLELSKSNTPREPPRRYSSPARVVLTSPNQSVKPAVTQVPKMNRASSPYSERSRSLSPGPSSSKQTSVEPSFHVTMSMKLSNPLVTKVTNGPLNKKQQERRSNTGFSDLKRNSSGFESGKQFGNPGTNQHEISKEQMERRYISPSFSHFNQNDSSDPTSKDQYYRSMVADQLEMSKGLGAEKALKQRLGSKGHTWNKMESPGDKKRVSFGNVRTKEIPAVPGTQPLNSNATMLYKQIYRGSVALRTAKKL